MSSFKASCTRILSLTLRQLGNWTSISNKFKSHSEMPNWIVENIYMFCFINIQNITSTFNAKHLKFNKYFLFRSK